MARPDYVRVTVGVVLVLYSAYSLARPAMKPVKRGGAAADAGVAFLNGILGGLTGLAGILTTIWCGIRGWPKDEQRAVFQPIGVGSTREQRQAPSRAFATRYPYLCPKPPKRRMMGVCL